jgi:phosphotriesterase-related protein
MHRALQPTERPKRLPSTLTDEIENSGVRADWVKIGASDDGITEAEGKVLRAAVAASLATGATIGATP